MRRGIRCDGNARDAGMTLDGSVAQRGERFSDGSRAVSEGGQLGAAVGRGMEHDRDEQEVAT